MARGSFRLSIMRIVVTGASGFIGVVLCRELLARGHTLRAVVRHSSPRAIKPSALDEIEIPDIAGEFDRRALFEGCDAVVHLAAVAHRAADEATLRRVNVDATLRLAEAAAGRVRRFVFLSSVKVHGDDSGNGAYSESDEPFPQDPYGRSKLAAEWELNGLSARTGIEVVAIRPPLVYGPGVKANFLRLLRWINLGRPLPFGRVRNRRSLIYVGNLAAAIVRAVEHSSALGGPLLVSDEEIVSTPELISRIALALGRPMRLVSIPLALLRLAGALAGKGEEIGRLTGNLVLDVSKARRLLDWRPPHTLDQGLAETARWFKSMLR
jgi:nucleoside-diphosphate-sugar epimerase